jgi:hypothetical protein
MRIRLPQRHTCIVDLSGRDQYYRMPHPDLALVIKDMGLHYELGDG